MIYIYWLYYAAIIKKHIGALVIQGVKGSVEEDRIRTHLLQQDWFRAEFQHSTRRDGSRFQPTQYAWGNEIGNEIEVLI